MLGFLRLCCLSILSGEFYVIPFIYAFRTVYFLYSLPGYFCYYLIHFKSTFKELLAFHLGIFFFPNSNVQNFNYNLLEGNRTVVFVFVSIFSENGVRAKRSIWKTVKCDKNIKHIQRSSIHDYILNRKQQTKIYSCKELQFITN